MFTILCMMYLKVRFIISFNSTLLLGEAKKAIALLVTYLRRNFGVSLENLNNAVIHFGYGFYDKSNKPGGFSTGVLTDASIGQRASQCMVLLRLLPVIFRQWIQNLKENDMILKHVRYFLEFVQVLLMPSMTVGK